MRRAGQILRRETRGDGVLVDPAESDATGRGRCGCGSKDGCYGVVRAEDVGVGGVSVGGIRARARRCVDLAGGDSLLTARAT